MLIFRISMFVIFIFGMSAIIFVLAENQKVTQNSFSAMGTNITITIAENKFNKNVFNDALKEFKRVENIFRNNPDLNNAEVKQLFDLALKVQAETDGAFSPFLGSVIKLWKFNNYSKKITVMPTKKQIQKALKEKKLNLYALAKGYGIDKAGEVLISAGINNFMINAGGDILVKGTKFGKHWKIGIRDSSKVLACNLDQYSIATSSNLYNHYILNGKKYGHLLNGNTGYPTMAEKSVSVIANNTTIADTYATAFFTHDNLKTKVKNLAFIKTENSKFEILNLPKSCTIRSN
ncbi:MAG: FAD:protein FMN transferase [Proteobacteria bacterium]|nr:FAD:protein FMN transferase [Pseudomonadota bacterium]